MLKLDLPTIIEKAKHRGAVLSPPGHLVVEIRIDGSPSYLMSNAIAAMQSEIEDIFLRKTEMIGGGAGCLLVDLDLGLIPEDAEKEISAFFADPENIDYFRRRYGISEARVKRTPRYV